MVRLSIEITEVLAVGSDDPVYQSRRSDFMKGKIADVIGQRVSIYADVAGHTSPPNNDGDLIGPTSKPLTSEDVRTLYVGRSFIFSVSPAFVGEPHWATAWPLESKEWVSKTLHTFNGTGCPHPYVPGRTRST
jgi:hypothetical protein